MLDRQGKRGADLAAERVKSVFQRQWNQTQQRWPPRSTRRSTVNAAAQLLADRTDLLDPPKLLVDSCRRSQVLNELIALVWRDDDGSFF
jgi:hypothetical protein